MRQNWTFPEHWRSRLWQKNIKVIAVKTDDVKGQLGKDLKEAVESEDFYKAVSDKKSSFQSFQKPDWWTEKYKEK